MDASGLRFLRFSESGSLDLDIYGMSYVTEAFVGRAIARLGAGLAWRRFPKGIYENQDLYVVGAPGVDLAQLKVASTPMGGLERLSHLTHGGLELAGWLIERTPGEAVEQVIVLRDEEVLAQAEPREPRPDVLRHFPGAANAPQAWRLRLRPAQVSAGARLRIELRSSSGLVGMAYAEVPAPAAMTYSGWSRRALNTQS
jgi:hypothetical protein